MQKERQSGLPLLYSLQGHRYCDLLLAEGRHGEVWERAEQTLKRGLDGGWYTLLDSALDTLSLGRAAHMAWLEAIGARPVGVRHSGADIISIAPAGKTVPDRRSDTDTAKALAAEAQSRLDEAVAGLRRAGQEDDLPRGLLARAAYRRDISDLAGCQQDLAEVYEIAHRGDMRLHLTDYCLEWGRMLLAADPGLTEPANRTHADTCCRAAADLVAATGYHRRDGEVAALRVAIDACA